jgi:ABC-type multidrug transport system ATPase subunit
LNLGQIVARGSVAEVISRVQNNIVMKNVLRIQVSPSVFQKAQEELQAMSLIKKVTPIGETEGLLRIELEAFSDEKGSKLVEEINNKILSTLIRAKIPIRGFEIEGGKLQDVFLHLTEEAIK